MKYRKVLAVAAMIGMMAATGCSRGALPENNDGNHNGERLVRSVTRSANRNNETRSGNETRDDGLFEGIERQNTLHNRNVENNRNNPNRYERPNRNNRGLTRNYVSGRTHRATAPDYALNNRYLGECYPNGCYEYDQTVSVAAMDNDDNAFVPDESIAVRRLLGRPAPEAQPTDTPPPAPEAEHDIYDGEETEETVTDVTEEAEEVEEAAPEADDEPDDVPVPAKQGAVTNRLMK